MSREEARKLYEGKFFYEIVKPKSGRYAGYIQLAGPLDNIYYANRRDVGGPEEKQYKFVQVVDGTIVQAFTEKEILVTDREL